MKREKNMNQIHVRLSIAGVMCLIVLLALSGCSSNYGNIRWNSETTQIFRTYTVLPDHNYYYSGGDARPNAIMGIHQRYTLVSDLWKKVDLNSDQLKEWVNNMVGRDLFKTSPDGYVISDAEGNRIGVWYSMWDWTTVKLESGNRVFITTPNTTSRHSKRIGVWTEN